jgi:organic radical activating enzyme
VLCDLLRFLYSESVSYDWPLFVYPTRACNYRCSYCFTDSSPARVIDGFVIRNWQRLVDEASRAGVPEIRLSGGEPLVIPQIEQMCRAITMRGMRYTLTTNGSLLARHTQWLKDVPPETLWISFHREYHTVESFLDVSMTIARELPRVGVNVFSSDWDDRFASAGAVRVKLLSQSAVGRAQASLADAQTVPRLDHAIELRYESTMRQGGPATCVLRDRPLLSIDHDGAAYACCVTVGHVPARVGDLATEPLGAILGRVNEPAGELPCGALLPGVLTGAEGCPVRLYRAD